MEWHGWRTHARALQSLDGRIEILASRSAAAGYDPTEAKLDLEEIGEIQQLKAEIADKVRPAGRVGWSPEEVGCTQLTAGPRTLHVPEYPEYPA